MLKVECDFIQQDDLEMMTDEMYKSGVFKKSCPTVTISLVIVNCFHFSDIFIKKINHYFLNVTWGKGANI